MSDAAQKNVEAPEVEAKTNGASAPDPGPAKLITTKKREKVVKMEWGTVEFDGKVWDSVTVRRLTGKEVTDYLEALENAKDGETVPPPMLDCPMEVYMGMDDDDRFAVDEAIEDFLPRRLKAAPDESDLQTTASTSVQ